METKRPRGRPPGSGREVKFVRIDSTAHPDTKKAWLESGKTLDRVMRDSLGLP